MRKNRLGIIGAAMMMAASMAAPASIASANAPAQQSQQTTANSKAVKPEAKKRNRKTVLQSGGLNIEGQWRVGTPPKVYGLANYHGNKAKKVNMLRVKHNAKLKRRIA